jgi:hypothetical protein
VVVRWRQILNFGEQQAGTDAITTVSRAVLGTSIFRFGNNDSYVTGTPLVGVNMLVPREENLQFTARQLVLCL